MKFDVKAQMYFDEDLDKKLQEGLDDIITRIKLDPQEEIDDGFLEYYASEITEVFGDYLQAQI